MTSPWSRHLNSPATLAKEAGQYVQHTLGLNCRSMRLMGEHLPSRLPRCFPHLWFPWTRRGRTTLNSGSGQPFLSVLELSAQLAELWMITCRAFWRDRQLSGSNMADNLSSGIFHARETLKRGLVLQWQPTMGADLQSQEWST